jgi:hypothetical protein
VLVQGTIEADATVDSGNPSTNFGTGPGPGTELWADADVAKMFFVRARVTGVGTGSVVQAILRLRTGSNSDAGSNVGGRLFGVTNCGWSETALTWINRPAIDGGFLASRGAVAASTTVDFNVTAAVAGDGAYCFAVDSFSADGVTYNSREAGSGRPEIWITYRPGSTTSTTTTTSPTTSTTTLPGVCGDGTINQMGEHCDGADDDACPGECHQNCTCPPGMPVCGDGLVNRPSEECDGADDAECPEACAMDCTCGDAPFCGDGHVNRASEECDGADDAACPGECESDCTCPAPPVCGDNDINQAGEQCDGIDAPACPGACRTDCTCAPAACGDNHVNRSVEDCDGVDDAACPGRCLEDCTCDTTLPVGVVEADVAALEKDRTLNFGSSPFLWVDADSPQVSYLRMRVRGVGALPVLSATLTLQVADDNSADSDSGGRIHRITDCTWNELAMTYDTRPAIDGPMLDEAAHAVQIGDPVVFDLTTAITGDGTYCFALDSASTDGVQYASREGLVGRPLLDVVAAGTCGDGRWNQASEECDGIDDGACPAACLADCTCAVCGDGLTDFPAETCDGSDDDACSGQCGVDCSCPDLPLPSFACLGPGGADITLQGVFLDPYRNDTLAPGTEIDARRAAVVAFPDDAHPINLGGGQNGCLAGGTVLGQYDRGLSWDQMHDFNNAAVAFTNPLFIADGVRIDNMTDGIRPRNGGTFTVRSAWLSYVRDDCIENDHLQDGLVDDSLFDGCYVAFSARPSQENIDAGYDGSGSVWTIQNSLVRLEAMPGPAGGSPTEMGHGGFFKWHSWNDATLSLSPKLALYDNVFMAEEVGHVGASRMGTPPDQVIDCANNVMVWLGGGEFPGTLPSCFTVTTDRSVWDAAVADWHERHPYVGW